MDYITFKVPSTQSEYARATLKCYGIEFTMGVHIEAEKPKVTDNNVTNLILDLQFDLKKMNLSQEEKIEIFREFASSHNLTDEQVALIERQILKVRDGTFGKPPGQ